jgi:hypothetical protein
LIAHFPPEWLQFESSYNCILSNNWDYTYIDSLGIWNASESQQNKTNNNTEMFQMVESTDIRYWIQVAFGMNRKINSLGHEFK